MWLIILFVISFIRWHLVKNFLFLSGLLLLVLLTFTLLVCRRRRRHLKKLKSEKKRQREAEREMELKTRSCRHSGYRLAFDNPYYAMAMDDDVEEDYINPLCDLDSLMSHQESEGTVSSATECSIQKGESLQSVSYCWIPKNCTWGRRDCRYDEVILNDNVAVTMSLRHCCDVKSRITSLLYDGVSQGKMAYCW
jgi:hypothetical protein